MNLIFRIFVKGLVLQVPITGLYLSDLKCYNYHKLVYKNLWDTASQFVVCFQNMIFYLARRWKLQTRVLQTHLTMF